MSGDEAPSAEYRAKMSCMFLHKEMKSGVTFTFDKTIQTAISGFQHLFGREVEAHEILAFAWKDGDTFGKELKQWRKNPNLDELLASIHEPDNDDPDTVMAHLGLEELTLFLKKCKAHSKEGRSKRRKKVRKSRSKKARKEIGDGQDTVEDV